MVTGAVHEFALAAAGLVLMGMTGGFAVSAFRLPFGFLAAPIAGIGIFSLGVVALWVEAGTSFTVAAAVTISCGSVLTIFEWWRGRLPIRLAPSIVAILLLAVSVGLNDIATIRASSPSIHAGDFNDQMNYAQIADWVLAHRAADLRKPPVDEVYERIPRGQLLDSTRPATYFLLAFVAKLRGTSGLFAYDLASAIAWAAGILGVAAAVARTPASLILITIMLSTAGWFDFARTGFLGKLMAYPAALMLVALAISVRPTPKRIFSLLLLAVGAATLHVGTVVALMVGSIGGVFLLAEFLRTRKLPVLHAYMISGVFAAAVATTGALVKFARAPFPDENRDWPYIVTRILDLKMQRDVGLEMTDAIGHPLAALCVAICIMLGGVAWRRGRMDAFAFAIAPLLLLAGLAGARANAVALQLIGFAYPASLCAIALLLNERDPGRWKGAVAVLAVLYVGLHIPRFWFVADRYAISARPLSSYALAEFDEIARLLKGHPVVVDTDNYIVSFVMRAELMRRGLPTQWTERGWLTAGLHHFESGRPAPPHDPGLMRLTMTPQPGWHIVYAATGFLLIAPE